MPKRRRRAPDGQLALPFESSPAPVPASVEAGALVALHGAVRLLLDVAEGRVVPATGTVTAVQRALDVLAAHQPRGRLGHVVRRYRSTPLTATSWPELVDELAFVLSLASGEAPPEPAPTR